MGWTFTSYVEELYYSRYFHVNSCIGWTFTSYVEELYNSRYFHVKSYMGWTFKSYHAYVEELYNSRYFYAKSYMGWTFASHFEELYDSRYFHVRIALHKAQCIRYLGNLLIWIIVPLTGVILNTYGYADELTVGHDFWTLVQ